VARHDDDATVVARCRDGDDAAWAELVERYSRYVHAIATRGFGLSGDEAEDVFQEAFTRTYVHLSSLHEDVAIRPWLAQVTRRLAIDQIRGRARAGGDDRMLPAVIEDYEHRIEEIDSALDVHQAMERLPERCQEILDRFFARDQSYRTIAQALELPMGTIASRIARCLGKLRVELEGKKPTSTTVQ
jgi:RNA polymerase sigma-70 factor (ECF subfamily)